MGPFTFANILCSIHTILVPVMEEQMPFRSEAHWRVLNLNWKKRRNSGFISNSHAHDGIPMISIQLWLLLFFIEINRIHTQTGNVISGIPFCDVTRCTSTFQSPFHLEHQNEFITYHNILWNRTANNSYFFCRSIYIYIYAKKRYIRANAVYCLNVMDNYNPSN